jgi:hypothetical protein
MTVLGGIMTIAACFAWIALGLVLLAFLYGVSRIIEHLTSSDRLRDLPHDAIARAGDVHQANVFHAQQHITGRQQDHAQ